MWSGNGPIKTIDSPGYAEALRMAQAEDETLGIRNIYGTRSSKEQYFIHLTKGGFFSESAICFFKYPKKNIPKNYPELEI